MDSGITIDGSRTFNLLMQNGTTTFFSGIETVSSGYNGNYLGPTLFMEKGEWQKIRWPLWQKIGLDPSQIEWLYLESIREAEKLLKSTLS